MSQDDAGVLTPTIAAREAWMASRHLHSYLNTDQGAQFTRDGFTDWTVERIRREAASIGPATAALCELILEHRPHPEQGFRACLGIVRLVRPFGADRLEAAATGAIEIGTLTYGSVRSILDNKLDRQTAQRSPPMACRSSTPISADRVTTTEENAVLTHP